MDMESMEPSVCTIILVKTGDGIGSVGTWLKRIHPIPATGAEM